MATYFVDATGGNDLNAGTSSGAAWQHLSKVNSSTFSGDDTIGLKCGETWNERLVPPNSGTAGHYIHFTKYGSGALPIIVATTGRAESISLGTGITYNKISYIECRGGDAASASALIESQSITNLISFCTIDGQNTLADSCLGGPMTAEDCLIKNARDDGSTMHNGDSSTYTRCTYTGNRSAVNNSTVGPAMSGTYDDCIFYDNGDGSSTSFGDVNGLGGGTWVFNRCDFRGRSDGLNNGYVTGSGEAGENATFNECRFNNKNGTTLSKGSFSATTGSTHTYNNCTFVGNTGGDGNSGAMNADPGTMNFVNCIFYYFWKITNNAGGAGGTVNMDCCLISNLVTLTVNTNTNRVGTNSTDPLFTNYSTSDYTLQSTSPAKWVTGATSSATTDLAGNPIHNPPSLGCYEYIAPGTVIINVTTLTATSMHVG